MRKDKSIRNSEDLGQDPDDQFWVRPTDIKGNGILHQVENLDGHLHVEIRCGSIPLYLDTMNIAAFGDLHNLGELVEGAMVSLEGNIRSLTAQGVRLGRLALSPSDSPIQEAVFIPQRLGGNILLGGEMIPDPGSQWESFRLVPQDSAQSHFAIAGGLGFAPC